MYSITITVALLHATACYYLASVNVMLPVATDNPVTWCVSQSAMQLCCAKMAKWVEVLFGVESLGDQCPYGNRECGETFTHCKVQEHC